MICWLKRREPVLSWRWVSISLLFVLGLVSLESRVSAQEPAPPPVVGHDLVVGVAPESNLYTAARAQGLALEHLAFANRLPVSLAPLTQDSLLIPHRRILPTAPPRDGLVLNLPERGIFLFRGGEFRGFFPVAIGALGWETPVGNYEIATKTVDPIWYPPAWAGVGYPVMPGPQNPLGDRWLGLSLGGYGIHSTNRPDSIGGAVSHGCIRSYPEHAHKLYEQVYVGMPVRVEYCPVKLGRDPETGQLEMAVFRDVYDRVDLLSEAQKLLRQYGLDPRVAGDAVRSLVVGRRGVATAVFDQPIRLDTDAGEVECSGFLIQGRLYVESSDLIELELYQQPIPGIQVLNFDGREFVPAVGAFPEMLLRWDGARRTLYLRRAQAR